jgi:hypothetical protein
LAVSDTRQESEGPSAPSLSGGRTIGKQHSSARLTPKSWEPEHSLELREWGEHGRRMGSIGRAVAWWIGDWLRYGNSQFGERYVRASRITGYDVQTLMNMVYVATHFEFSQRRENLSWSHHAEVCALAPEERDRWLDLAERERMSVRCMREEIRRARRLAAGETDAGAAVADLAASTPATDDGRVCPHCGTVLSTDVDGQAAAPGA